MKARDLLLYISNKQNGDWNATLKAIKAKEFVSPQDVSDYVRALKRPCITILDPDYPEPLKHISQPPFVLYYKGNRNLINDMNRSVTLVGSRDSTPYGLKRSREIAEGLAKEGITVISGLARGIDAAAIRGAVGYGKAVGVLGNGLDFHYPSENRELQDEVAEKGLLLSEYPDGVKPEKHHFPDRNRILAGLSCLTLLGGSKSHSGTLITAGFALDYGRDVACLPYRADEDSGNNLLIQTGACLVQNTEDVLNLLPGFRQKKKISESPYK